MLFKVKNKQPLMKKNLHILAIILIVMGSSAYLLMDSYQQILSVFSQSKEAISSQQYKRNLLTQMYNASRERSFILLNMFRLDDPFELDELNQALSEQASLFIQAQDDFKELPLSDKEINLLDTQNKLVRENAPLQSRVAALLLTQNRENAEQVLFEQALPGQNRVLKHIKLFLNEDSKAINNTIDTLSEGIKESGNNFFWLGILFTVTTFFIIGLVLTRSSKKEQLQLEASLKERDIFNQRLNIEKNRAENANAAKSEFLANMSHEIRTPMNAILGMSHLALKTNLTAKQENYISKAHRAAQNLLNILNDILDFSKMESGKLEMEEIEFKLADVINNTLDNIYFIANEKNIDISIKKDNNLPNEFLGDPLRLTQVLTNLISNAVKFSAQDDRITIQISLEKYENSKFYIQFSVQDTGIGMSTEQCDKLFRPFSQGDNSITREYGGTGLGLVISHKIVELMDGKIWLESEKNVGTTFYFTASFKSVANNNEIDQSTDNTNTTEVNESSTNLNGAKILLADDNLFNQEVAKEFLESNDIIVKVANDGLEVLELLKQEEFDGILMDCMMPNMDGYQATKKIREQEQFKDLPIIAMTANAMKGERERVIETGMNDYISKPVSPTVMFNTMEKWIKITPK